MEPVNQSFADLLTELRISKVQLSKDLDISRQTIENIVNGTFLPSLKIIYKVLKAFPWISPDWLITNEGLIKREDTEKQKNKMEYKIAMLETTVSELRKTINAQELTIELLNEYRKNKTGL